MELHPDDPAIMKLLNHKCITEENEIRRVISEIKVSDAIEKTINAAKDFVFEAKNCLDVFEDEEDKQLLSSLASFTIDRTL
jgi:geranylgeranyl pyrophosphate synthase